MEKVKKNEELWNDEEKGCLKKLKKQGWSTSTYSGEVPEEMRWEAGI